MQTPSTGPGMCTLRRPQGGAPLVCSSTERHCLPCSSAWGGSREGLPSSLRSPGASAHRGQCRPVPLGPWPGCPCEPEAPPRMQSASSPPSPSQHPARADPPRGSTPRDGWMEEDKAEPARAEKEHASLPGSSASSLVHTQPHLPLGFCITCLALF